MASYLVGGSQVRYRADGDGTAKGGDTASGAEKQKNKNKDRFC